MHVLVTGGAGFIGSHLVDRLLAEGHRVTVIDNCSTGREENLAHLANEPRLRFLRASILNDTLVAAVMAEVDRCYHLAAAVGVGHVVADPLWAIVTNARGTEIVLRRAAQFGVRTVFASSSEVYGQNDDTPFREDSHRVLGPTWVHRWCYSTSKALDEHLCFAYADRGLAVSVIRYFNIYGPRMDPLGYGSVIARFITQALAGLPLTVHGDGEQRRCFTYVSDAVEATLRAGNLPEAVGQVFNVGGTEERSVNDLAREILRLTGSSSKIEYVSYEQAYGPHFADPRRRVPDTSKAARLLGWQPVIGLTEGLAQTIAERRRQA